MTTCVRCNSAFEQANHPMAHFFTICHGCRNESEETLSDQQVYNIKQFGGSIPYLTLSNSTPLK